MTDPIAPWPGEIVDCDGVSVFVRATPAVPGADPALFVHGLGGSSLNWTDLMDLLRQPPGGSAAGQELNCVAIDLPGFGFSPVPADGRYSVSAHADAVIALITKRGNWPVHLIGNSLGGAVCTRVAGRRPDLVRTMTLVSPALPDLRPRPLPVRLGLVTAPGIGMWMMRRLQRLPAELRATRSFHDLYRDPALVHPARRAAEIEEVLRRDALDYSADALVRSARSLVTEYARIGPGSLWRDAARVTAPALVIHGSHDRLVNPIMSTRAARVFPDARVVVLPRVGHVAMMERPDLVAREVRDFLAAHSAALSVR